MIACDSLKEKIIIVAEHDEKSMQKIVAALEGKGFFNIRQANNGEKIYEILRPYHDQPEKIGLIIVNEKLPFCRVRYYVSEPGFCNRRFGNSLCNSR